MTDTSAPTDPARARRRELLIAELVGACAARSLLDPEGDPLTHGVTTLPDLITHIKER